jgi:hypothetical protein
MAERLSQRMQNEFLRDFNTPKSLYAASGLFRKASPVDMHSEPKYEKIGAANADSRMKRIKRRLFPWVEATNVADKMYSAGYSENHYPKADKLAKRLMDEHMKLAASRMLADDDNEPGEGMEESKERPLSITISVGR